jgi:acetyl esterase
MDRRLLTETLSANCQPFRPPTSWIMRGAFKRFALLAAFSIVGSLLAVTTSTAAADPMARTGTKFKADADMQSVLDALAAMNPKPIESLAVAEARKQPTPADAVKELLKRQGKDTSPAALVPGVTSEDRTIPGPASALPVRIYTPAGAGPFPVIVYFHGGGWVIADKEVYDGGARGLAKEAGAVVVSVDYRRAPEVKFPAAWDDAFAAYKWVAQNAASIKGHPKKLALAGESAGGNLAIATAIAARDAGVQAPLHIVAVYPVAQTGDMMTQSYVDSASAKPLNKAMIGWFVDKLLAKPEAKTDPRLDLVHANLKGLPPVTIINAQIDPLRSDGDLLEAALKKAEVKVEHKLYSGVAHEFFGMAAVVKKAKEAQALAGSHLKKAFAG